MKKTFEYDLTKYSPDAPTRTEEFITADGVKTLTTDANDGAVLIQDKVDEDSLNPVTAAAVAAAIEGGGGGTEYSAGDGIAISEGEISAKLADGSGLRFDQGGLQIVHQLATPGAGDQGKVLTVTNSLGAYAWADPQAAAVNVDSNSALAGTGTQASPLSMNLDSDTLEVKEGVYSVASGSTFAGDSDMAYYLDSHRPTTVTFAGITPDASSRSVYVVIRYSNGNASISFNTLMTVAANATSATYSLDLDDIADWSDGNWQTSDSRNYSFYLSYFDGDTYSAVAYSTASFSSGVKELAVSNPLPSSLGTAGQVLTVNSGATGVEWATPSGGGAGVEYVTRSNTFEEVLAAYQAGKLPVLEYEIGGTKYFYVMSKYSPSDGHYLYKGVFLFTQWSGSSNDGYTHVLAGQLGVGMYTCYRDGNGATQWSFSTKYILPDYGNGDAGKVLQVQSGGTLAWVTLT